MMCRRSIWKIFLIAFGSLVGVLVMVVGGWTIAQHFRDPLHVLDRPAGSSTLVADSTYLVETGAETREYHDVILADLSGDTIRMTVSLPASGPVDSLPVLIILGGLEVGRESLKYIPYHGNNVLIAYQYPYSPTYWYQGTAFSEIPEIRRAVFAVPAQVNTIVQWSRRQPWADGTPPNLLGYSFGALFLPATYHLAGVQHIELGSGVLAYGGANIYQILRTNLQKVAEPVRTLVAWTAAAALRPMEPALHLPSLDSRFLIMNGTADHQIPTASSLLLHRLAPVGSTILTLEAGHMHPKNPELTARLVGISRQWLLTRGAINP